MKILYCGQKPVGESCFAELLSRGVKGLEVVGAVSNSTTENWWGSARVAALARQNGIPFLSNETKNEAALLRLMEWSKPDVLLSVQHPWILSSAILGAVRENAFNLHLAPLPDYRGWHAFSHAILNQSTEFGVSLHWMVPRVDSGEIAYESRFPVKPDDTAQRLYTRAVASGERLFGLLLDDLEAGRAPPRRPLSGKGRYYAKSDLDSKRELSRHDDLQLLARAARAFHFPAAEPAYLRIGDQKIYLVPAEAAGSQASPD